VNGFSRSPAPQSIEDRWRERLRLALNCYQFARAECVKARLIAQCGVESQDAFFARRRALHRKGLRNETAALAEYRRVLVIFNNLTVNGMMPPEE